MFLGRYLFTNVLFARHSLSCSHVQYNNAVGKLLGKTFWVLFYKNNKATFSSNLT